MNDKAKKYLLIVRSVGWFRPEIIIFCFIRARAKSWQKCQLYENCIDELLLVTSTCLDG